MTVTGLENGRLYWFRVVALDVAGRQLLASGPIMTVPGPPPIPSVSMPVQMEGRFSWSPGGDSIAFVDASASGQRSLALLDLRTLAVTHLVDYSGEDWISDAILSPDGSAVAFTHTPTRMAGGIDYRVWTTELSPVAPKVQTPGRVDFDPAWGGGGWIYFCRGTHGPPNIPEIWRVRPGDTSSLQAITSDPSVYKYNPSVRRSDDLVVYEGRPRGARYLTAGLFTIRPGMGAAAVLTPPDAYWDTFPFWAPDGRQVVFVSTRSGHPEVWTVDVGSGALRQVTRGPRGANRLLGQWSPDGSLLAVLEGGGRRTAVEIYEAPSLAP